MPICLEPDPLRQETIALFNKHEQEREIERETDIVCMCMENLNLHRSDGKNEPRATQYGAKGMVPSVTWFGCQNSSDRMYPGLSQGVPGRQMGSMRKSWRGDPSMAAVVAKHT